MMDPLARVTGLGGRDPARGVIVGVLLALLLHGALVARAALIRLELTRWTQELRAQLHERLLASCDVDIVKLPAPEPPAPPDQTPPPPPPAAVWKSVTPTPEAPAAPAAPAPVAQAGPVLTVPSDTRDPESGGQVTGEGEMRGGITAPAGTGTVAAHHPAPGPACSASNCYGATPPPSPPPARDLTRAATRNGASDWRCPWPAEADAESIDDAYVTIQVTVDPSGRASRVSVLRDPGHGFGREARSCAMKERFNAALDREGNRVVGDTQPFRIHFER